MKRLILFLFVCSICWAELPRIIPMQDFFKNPQQVRFQLSPDGQYISFLAPWENRLNVHVQKIGEDKVTRITSCSHRDILGYMWANNSRLVYVQDQGGDENFKPYAVNRDGTEPKALIAYDKVRIELVDDLENSDEEMLIAMNHRDPRIFDVYRINIYTGELKMIAENPGNISDWITDHEGKLRIATVTDGVNTGMLYRETEDKPWQLMFHTNFKEAMGPLFFTFDNQNLYVASNIGRDKAAIYEYDLKANKIGKLIYEHPDVDVGRLLASKKQKKIIGVAYVTDKRKVYFWDEEFSRIQKDLEQKLPGYEVALGSMSKDETKALVVAYSDKTRGMYYFYDCTTSELRPLVNTSPWLLESEMADMTPIEFKARDGLVIPGYLTLPKGVEPKGLPVVVNPHGGPWYRDQWGFNPEVQFLANRGYAVLQINFRGSTGYGRAFWEASFKKWGKEMQDDITDGVKWLIEKGIADPKRVGIYGGSYGGYAVLAGLAFTPDVYACGVDYVGISNIFTFYSAIPPYWEPYLQMFYEMIGDPKKDAELLKAASPLFYADKIKAPLFIAQGANDPRVKKAESDQMVAALKERGIDVPYMVKDNEGHGFLNQENRFDFYRAMEQFFAKYLGGRVEAQ